MITLYIANRRTSFHSLTNEDRIISTRVGIDFQLNYSVGDAKDAALMFALVDESNDRKTVVVPDELEDRRKRKSPQGTSVALALAQLP